MSDEPVLEDPPAAPAPLDGRRRLPRAVPGLVLLALLLMAAAGGVRAVAHRLDKPEGTSGLRVANQEAVDSGVRHQAVAFDGRLLADGRGWSSASARGSILVVNLWASWCGPCRAEQPALSTVARAYRNQHVVFVGVNIRDQKANATAYADEFRIPYPSLFDPGAETATKLRAFGLPTTFIVDRDGVLAYQLTGKTTVPILAARLDTLLANGGRWVG
jgi:thiol-disulfide isomerase/thioredoxin